MALDVMRTPRARKVAWVNAGVDLLRRDSRVREAFVLANRTVEATAGGAYDSWRPFQVAWIVGCLPAMADQTSTPPSTSFGSPRAAASRRPTSV